jgi:hypothetical protein
MTWNALKERFKPGVRRRTGPFVLPAVALEIEPDFVAGARLNATARQVERVAVRELETRALQPLPNRSNFSEEAGLRQAIRSVTDAIGNGTGYVGLLVPDGTARVGILSFETLPDYHAEAEALVRWRMKEVLPYPAEEARLSCQILRNEPGNIEMLAVAARGSVISEYELALEHLNGGPALILPATMALLPLLPDRDEAGQLLIHVCSGWVTTVVVVGNSVRLWRNRDLGRMELPELAGDVAREAARVLASSRDHLKVEIERVRLCARPPATAELGAELARVLAHPVEPLAPRSELAAALPGTERLLFERFGATFAGLVSNPS